MNTELVREVYSIVEANVKSRPSPVEFEMGYQIRVAIDRIRFAIKATDQFTHDPKQMQEAGLQLMDALDRLESAERALQQRFRSGIQSGSSGERHKPPAGLENGFSRAQQS